MLSKLKGLLTWKTLILFLLIVITAAAIAFGYYFYAKYQKVLHNPDIVSNQEVSWLTERVGKLMQLPTDETPSTATVLDKDKLKDQAFFKNAENGDKILIYASNKKAILYRPSADKIIEVMPVTIDTNSNAGATTQNIKVALLNGSTTDGLTNTAEINIKNKIANVDVVSKDKAAKTDYKNTIVVDLKGDKGDQAKAIADAVGGEIGSLPAGEAKPDVDILVIVAK